MNKILFYAMTGEKMCFQHILLNALDLADGGAEVQIIFEGASVKLPPVLAQEGNKHSSKPSNQALSPGSAWLVPTLWAFTT